MTFWLIKGTFHVMGVNKNGNSYGYQPDGDSMRFKPRNPTFLNDLEQTGWKYELNGSGHIQLRFEAIDALELHYDTSHQPNGELARDYLTNLLGFENVEYGPSGYIVTDTENDGLPGYILSKQLGPYGRPIAFVFIGEINKKDGAEVWLDTAWVKESVNAELLRAGQVYPLYYTSLYYDLRDALTQLVKSAQKNKKGIWKYDKTTKGFQVPNPQVLENDHVIFPKLYRRLWKFFKAKGSNASVSGFEKWLEASNKNDELIVASKAQYCHFNDVIKVNGKKVKLTAEPDDIIFVPE